MSDNQFPNQPWGDQQGYDPNQGYNPYQQITPTQGYNGPQQVQPNQGYDPYQQFPSQSSAEANKGVSGGKIVLIVLGCVLGGCLIIVLGFMLLFNFIRKKAEAALEEYTPTYSFDSYTDEEFSKAVEDLNETLQDEEFNEAVEELQESIQQLATDEALQEFQEIIEEAENATTEETTEESSEDDKVTSSENVVFNEEYFTTYQWEGLNDPALIIGESDGTFVWYRDREDKEGDYYSGTYKLYTGDEAVTYLTTESEDKDNITEQDIIDLEAPEYGATRENFVCLVLTNEVECYYGKETTYAPEDQITSNLYGYFVNDNDGYKLTLVTYGNPYEFNLVPKEKED